VGVSFEGLASRRDTRAAPVASDVFSTAWQIAPHQRPSHRPRKAATTLTRVVRTAGHPNAPAWKRPHLMKSPWVGRKSDIGSIPLAIKNKRAGMAQGVIND
jgi:hypothetical protein